VNQSDFVNFLNDVCADNQELAKLLIRKHIIPEVDKPEYSLVGRKGISALDLINTFFSRNNLNKDNIFVRIGKYAGEPIFQLASDYRK